MPDQGYKSNSAILKQNSAAGSPLAPAEAIAQTQDGRNTRNFDTAAYSNHMDRVQADSLFLDKDRAEGQSNWDKAGNAVIQSLGELGGGTISGIGSIGAFFTDILTEGGRQDADFSNLLMGVGDDIMKASQDAAPIYRKDPNKSFDMGDFGWWMQGVPSTVSSISMMIPAAGTIGLVGKIGEVLGLAGKMGKTAAWLSEVAGMTVISRNAENMRESLSVAQQAKQQVTDRVANMSAEDFDKLLMTTPEGQEFLNTGKEINPDNYAQFVAAKAGYQTYKVNAANIVFDFIQTAAAYKALSGITRGLGTSTAVADAEANLLGNKLSGLSKAKITLGNMGGHILGMGTEGVEEIVNEMGTREGNRIADRATGQDDKKSASERIASYLGDSHVWEAGFWGMAGGLLFEGGSHAMQKFGKVHQSANDIALAEVRNRQTHISDMAKAVAEITEAKKKGTITEEEANTALNNVTASSAFRMGLDASQAGQVDKVLGMLKNKDFKQTLLKNLTPEEQANMTDARYAEMTQSIADNVLEAERVHQTMNMKLFKTKADDITKNALYNKGISTAYTIYQAKKQQEDAAKDYDKFMQDNDYSAKKSNPDYHTTVDVQANTVIANTLQKQAYKMKAAGNNQAAEILSNQAEVHRTKAAELKQTVKDKVTLDEADQDLVDIRARQISLDNQIEISQKNFDNLSTKEGIAKLEKEEKARLAKKEKEKQATYKADITTRVKEGKITEAELVAEKAAVAGNTSLEKFIDSKITEVKEKSKVDAAKPVEPVDTTPVVTVSVTTTPVVNSESVQENLPVKETSPAPVSTEPATVTKTDVAKELGNLNPTQERRMKGYINELDALTGEEKKQRAQELYDQVIGGVLNENSATAKYLNQAMQSETVSTESADIVPVETAPMAEDSVMETGLGGKQKTNTEIVTPTPEPDKVPEAVEEKVVETPKKETKVEEVTSDKVESQIDLTPSEIKEPEEQAIITDTITDQEGTNVADLFIPSLHWALQNKQITKTDSGLWKVNSAETEDTIKTLQSLPLGTEVELFIDTENEFHQDNKENAAIGVKVDGKILFYLNTVDGINKVLASGKIPKRFLNRLQDNLVATIKIREAVWNAGADTRIVSTLKVKSPGTVIQSEKQRNPLDVLGTNWKLAYNKGENSRLLHVVGTRDKYVSGSRNNYFNHDLVYQKGGVYVLVPGFNYDGTMESMIPLYLNPGNLNGSSVSAVKGLILKVVDKFASGKASLKDEEIEEIRSQIKEYIAVNHVNQETSDLSGQIVTNVPKPYFKIHNNRVEFLFDNNTKLATIWYKDKVSGTPTLVIEEWKGTKSIFGSDAEYKAAKGKEIARYQKNHPKFDAALNKALSQKAYNVDFSKLENKSTTPEELFNTGRLVADFGALYDRNGNFLSNFWHKPETEESAGGKKGVNGNLLIGIDTNVKVQSTKEQIESSSIFEETSELANIGTKTQYFEYLKTIFPDSKVKNVVYHGSDEPIKNFSFEKKKNKEEKGLFFFSKRKSAQLWRDASFEENNTKKGDLKQVLLNLKNPTIVDFDDKSAWNMSKYANKDTKGDGLIAYNVDEMYVGRDTQYAVFELDQIHILGSEQDIKQFKEWVDKNQKTPLVVAEKKLIVPKETKTILQEEADDDPFADVRDLDLGNGKPMFIEGQKPNFDISTEERIANFQRMFGKNVKYDPNVDELIRFKGKQAYGLFKDALVRTVTFAPTGTEFHEGMHVVIDTYLTDPEKEQLFKEAKERYGINDENELEERLAEDFRNYAALRVSARPKSNIVGFIKEFFDRLLYAVKNFFGKATIDDLFANIYSGGFNYKPSEKTKSYAKSIGKTMEISVESSFTPQEIKAYVEWATMKVADHIPSVEGKKNSEVLENPDLYNLRKRIKKELQFHYDYLKKEGHVEAAKEVARVAKFWGENSNEGFWNLVIDNVKRKLNYDISYDESEVQAFDGNVQMRKDWDDRVAFAKSGKESFDFDLKRIIISSPSLRSISGRVTDNGVKVYEDYENGNPAMLPTPIEFNRIYPVLANAMVNANTIDEMVSRLYQLTEVDPSLITLADRLTRDVNMQAKWVSNFKKSFVADVHTRFTALKNGGFVIKVDESNKPFTLSNKWLSDIMNNIYLSTEGKYNGYDVEEFTEARNNMLQAKTLEDKLNSSFLLASIIGIDLSKETLTAITNSEVLANEFQGDKDTVFHNAIEEQLSWISNDLIESLKRGRPSLKSLNRLNILSTYVGYYEPAFVENSYINTQGNMVYSLMRPNFFTEFFDKFDRVQNPFNVNKEGAKKEVLELIQSYMKDSSFQFSNWLYNDGNKSGLLKIKAGEKTWDQVTIDDLNIDFFKNFQFLKIGDVKNSASGYGAGFADLSDADWDLQTLTNYAAGISKDFKSTIYPVLIQSDSGNIWGIRAKRYKVVLENGKIDRNTKMFQSMKNTVSQELLRMETASKLLFNRDQENYKIKPKKLSKDETSNLITKYHYATFNSRNFDNTDDIIGGIAQRDIVVDGEVWYNAGDVVTVAPRDFSSKGKIVFKKGEPTGNVFKFSTTDYVDDNGTLHTLNSIDGLRSYGVYDRVLYSKNEQAIEDHVANFAEWLVKKELGYFAKYKNQLAFSSNRAGTEPDFLSVWLSNDKTVENRTSLAFNDMVSEMALNTFINYVEQANWFNGTLAEYKGVSDTNKRAKQQSSPKQTTLTTYRGDSYKAIILKDIELGTPLLNTMIEEYKNQLSKQYPTWSKEKIEQKAEKIRSKYSDTNIADAQGFITLDRYEKVLKDYGRWNDKYANLFNKARKEQELNADELNQLLEVLKPFYYERSFDPITKTVRSRQVKTSLLPLIPALYKGTDMEKLINHATKLGVEELYFESAVKVGQGYISQVTDENGKLKEDFQDWIQTQSYSNDNWGIQLDVPNHIKDEVNTFGVQITKLAFANLSDNAIYQFGKEYTGAQIRQQFWDTLIENIKEDSENLIEEIGAEKSEVGGLTSVKLKSLDKVAKILKAEVQSKGLAKNFEEFVDVEKFGEKERFKMPLGIGSLSTKLVSTLTSLFTNNITRQKFPGGHVVIASSALLNNFNKVEGDEVLPSGIDFHSSVMDRVRSGDFKLQYRTVEDGKITEAEVLLPAWSEDFFKAGERMKIEDLPEDVRTMIGYRIPTEAKYSTVVFKVVGFLPEHLGSTIIMPSELVTQTGWDHDVDSLYIMQRTHKKVVNGRTASEFIANKLNIGQKDASKYINEIRKKTGTIEVPKAIREAYNEFAESGFEIHSIPYDKEKVPSELNRDQRNNRIFDLMYSIFTNPFHYPEIITPGNFDDAAALLKKTRTLLGIDSGNINPYTRHGQDFFRKQNIAGRSLKGMAANANAGLSVLQTVRATLREDLGFKVKYSLDDYSEETLRSKYGKDVTFTGKYAIVNHRLIGHNESNYLNIDDNVLTDHAAQMLAMVLDIVKEGFPLNVNTYTFNTVAAMLATGINIDTAGTFIRQPILNRLAELKLNNESVIQDISSKEYYLVQKEYMARLYWQMFQDGQITEAEAKQDGAWNKATGKLRTISDLSKRIGKKAKDRMKIDSIATKAFSIQELNDLLSKANPNNWKDLDAKSRIDFLKDQLSILQSWTNYEKAGQGFSDAILTLVTDKLGAGPTLNVTDNFLRQLTNTFQYADRKNSEGKTITEPRVFAKDTKGIEMAATEAIYSENSPYPSFPAYLKHSNLIAQKTLDPLVLQRAQGYKNLVGLVYAHTALLPSAKRDELVTKFANAVLLESVLGATNDLTGEPYINTDEKSRVLGVNVPVQFEAPTNLEEFKQLTTAQKLQFILANKSKYSEYLKDNTQILKRLSPKLQDNIVDKKGLHVIEFDKPKTSDGIDDYLVDSFEKLLNSDDDYIRNLATDLIAYDFFTSHFGYSSNSWNTYIPVSYYESNRINDQLHKLHNWLKVNTFQADSLLLDTFAQNNWYNTEVVPNPRTYYEYDAEGNKIIQYDEVTREEEAKQDQRFFDWDSKVSTISAFSVPKSQLLNEKASVYRAQFILLRNDKQSVLFKKYETGVENLDSVFNSEHEKNVYYYPVDKLGNKFGGMEFTTTSMYEENRVDFDYGDYVAQMEGAGYDLVQRAEAQKQSIEKLIVCPL